MELPLFSIITVVCNAEATIARTMESVLSQSFENYEHIIIDGVSNDNTLGIIESCRTDSPRIIVSEPDKGLYDAMNKGIGLAKGRYIIFLNSGDRFHSSDTLSDIAEAISSDESADILYGQTDLVDNDGRFVAPRHLSAPPELSLKDFSNGMVVCHQAFVVRKSIVPYFSLKYRFSSDYEWCIICLMNSENNVYIDKVLIDYLIEGLTTKNRFRSLRERFRIMSVYYGFWHTVRNHFRFVKRYFRHQKNLGDKMKTLNK